MTQLNQLNAYGVNTLRMFRFDNGSGNFVTDYSPAAQHAEVSNATWVAGGGLLFDATGETCQTEMPSWGNALSVFIRFKSKSGEGLSAAKFCCVGENDTTFQINRDLTLGDTGIKVHVNSQSIADRTVPDLFDMVEHTMLVAFNQSSSRCSVFVDGVLCGTTAATFTWPVLNAPLGIGNRPQGSLTLDRPLMATVNNFYMWNVELELADAQSLHANPEQMFKSSLTGIIGPQPASVNLTTEGVLDWRHFGLVNSTSQNYKDVTPSHFALTRNQASGTFSDGMSCEWTDGTPTVSALTQNGIFTAVLNNGYTITVACEANQRYRLKMYCQIYTSVAVTARVVATLGTMEYIQTFSYSGLGRNKVVVTLDFGTPVAGTLTLTLDMTARTDYGNVALQAVTLYEAPPPPSGTLVKIMCVGDSVTAGANGGSHAGNSYRYPLYTAWRDADKLEQYQVVGPYHGVSSSSLEPLVGYTEWPQDQSRHCGNGGWSTASLAASIQAWVTTYQPDVIFYFGAFIAMDTTTTVNFQAFIDNARAGNPNIKIYLGLPYVCTPFTEANATQYRTRLIEAYVSRNTVQSPLYLVDHAMGWNLEIHSGGYDGLAEQRYPTEAGNALIASNWISAMNRIAQPNPVEVTVTVDTDPLQNADYTSLGAALIGEAGIWPKRLFSDDLPAHNLKLKIVCRATTGVEDTTQATVIGFTTSAACNIVIMAPMNKWPQRMWDATLYRINPGGLVYDGIGIDVSNVIVAGLQVENNLLGQNTTCIDVGVTSHNVLIDSCIARSTVLSMTTHHIGFIVRGDAKNVRAVNCIAYGFTGTSAHSGGFYSYNRTLMDERFINCVAYNNRQGFFSNNVSWRPTCIGCVSIGNTTADYTNVYVRTSLNNISGDATAPGFSPLTAQTAVAVFVNAPASNFNWAVDSPAIAKLVDLAPTLLPWPNSAIAHWHLEETVAGNYTDAVAGHVGAGSLSPSVTVPGRMGSAQWFDGTEGITVPGHTDFDFALDESFSWEVWFTNTGATGTENKVLITREVPASNPHMWLGYSTTGYGNITLYDNNGVTSAVNVRGSTRRVDDGLFHHLVGVYDAALDKVLLYVDGELEAQSDAAFTGGFGNNGAEPLRIGQLGATGNQYRLIGTIDEVAIYRRALTLAEVREHRRIGIVAGDYTKAYEDDPGLYLSNQNIDPWTPYGYGGSGVGVPITRALTLTQVGGNLESEVLTAYLVARQAISGALLEMAGGGVTWLFSSDNISFAETLEIGPKAAGSVTPVYLKARVANDGTITTDQQSAKIGVYRT